MFFIWISELFITVYDNICAYILIYFYFWLLFTYILVLNLFIFQNFKFPCIVGSLPPLSHPPTHPPAHTHTSIDWSIHISSTKGKVTTSVHETNKQRESRLESDRVSGQARSIETIDQWKTIENAMSDIQTNTS